MRYSRRHKEETHNRLLKKAAEEFCRNGVQGTGIAPLMGRLGLTHGGFYAHFDSKNELIAQHKINVLRTSDAISIIPFIDAFKNIQRKRRLAALLHHVL